MKRTGKMTCLSCSYTDLSSFFQLLRGNEPKCPDCGSANVTSGEPQLRCSHCSETTMPRRHRLNSTVSPLRCAVCNGTEFEAVSKVPAGFL